MRFKAHGARRTVIIELLNDNRLVGRSAPVVSVKVTPDKVRFDEPAAMGVNTLFSCSTLEFTERGSGEAITTTAMTKTTSHSFKTLSAPKGR